MPRWVEIVLAATGLLLLTPLMILIAVAVVATSAGPALFAQERIGRDGRRFRIVKFRTMVRDAESVGGRLTVGGRDPRITSVGYFLRRHKLDELPQLWNVLVGDMSFVGPRPELPEYVDRWDPVQRGQLLLHTPGITDPASILYRNESERLALADDPEREYVDRILPRKLRINQRYLARRTAISDVGIILETLRRAVLRI